MDVADRRVWVLGKDRREKVPLTLPDQTMADTVSGAEPGPLFMNLDCTG